MNKKEAAVLCLVAFLVGQAKGQMQERKKVKKFAERQSMRIQMLCEYIRDRGDDPLAAYEKFRVNKEFIEIVAREEK